MASKVDEKYKSAEARENAARSRKAASEARTVALRRLRDLHEEDYRRLYQEECRARGVTPMEDRRILKRKRLLAELEALDAKP